MKTTQQTLFYTAVLMITGCGGGGGSSTPTPTPIDATPPSLQSSEPVDGAGPVSIVTDPRVTFSEALDAVTVNIDNVSLQNASSVQVRGEVSYDSASNSVIFTPIEPLAGGTVFTMTLNNISDLAGNTSPEVSVSFSTFLAPLVQSVSYRDGAIIGQTDTENDADGLPQRIINRADAGNDGLWQTGDETPRRYTEFTRDLNGDVISETSFSDAGVDGQWFTPDDVINGYRTFENDERGLNIRDIEWLSGPDGILATDDDVPRQYRERVFTTFGEERVLASFRTPGADGIWFNADDDPDRASIVRIYDDQGTLIRNTQVQRGPDNLVETADDSITRYFSVTRNDTEMRVELIEYDGAGDDGDWYTADDQIRNYQFSPFDSQGRQTGFLRGSNAGVDGIWFNSDDEIRTPINRFSYDDSDPTQTVLTITDYNELGADGLPLTADDVISRIRIQRLLEKNLRLEEDLFSSAGADGVWQTSDDEQTRYTMFDRDEDLNLLREASFGSPGPDGVYRTPDDVLLGELIYGDVR
ncbi:MAG: Ig-like domain-containing protein [Woeseiaceae bacterium]